MNTAELVEWQRRSPKGLIQCWWTHPCLDQLEQSDFSGLTWLEFGCGRGTSWLRSKCGYVVSIETDPDWAAQAQGDCLEAGLHNGTILGQHLRDGIAEDIPKYFAMIPAYEKFDIISVDGIFRDECLQWALNHFKGRGGLLIVDNLDQNFVWESEAALKLMEPHPCEIYYQPNHTNHWGKPWNTRIYYILP
jgi:predicted O-methyltransferase YrrM